MTGFIQQQFIQHTLYNTFSYWQKQNHDWVYIVAFHLHWYRNMTRPSSLQWVTREQEMKCLSIRFSVDDFKRCFWQMLHVFFAGYDCGMFVIAIAEHLCKELCEGYNIPLNDLINSESVLKKRTEIKQLIHQVAEEFATWQAPERFRVANSLDWKLKLKSEVQLYKILIQFHI